MRWEILYSEPFGEWWDGLTEAQQDALRVLFVFDPLRRAVFLLGGDKTGRWTEWYRTAVPIADDLFDEYLTAEGLT